MRAAPYLMQERIQMKSLYTIYIYVILALGSLFAGCREDLDFPDAPDVPTGEPAQITLSVNVGAFTSHTRAIDGDDVTARINSLWVATFDTDGDLTSKRLFTSRDLAVGSPTHPNSLQVTLDCYSGQNNIVAVANPVDNFGVWVNDTHDTVAEVVQHLEEVLDQVESLEDYKKIAALLTDPTSISNVSSNYLMSGVYKETLAHPVNGVEMYDPDTDDPTGWVIVRPGNSTLSGAIHLRRMVSMSHINIIAGQGVQLVPDYWQVKNIPSLSYASEQSGNAGSVAIALSKIDYYNNRSYNESARQMVFGKGKLETAKGEPVYIGIKNGALSTKVDKGGAGVSEAEGLSLEFFTFGNKHRGLDWVKNYTDRETEHKTPDGLNTGIFRSLVADPDDVANDNNNATFVEISVRITHWVDRDTHQPVAEGAPNSMMRSGTALLTVHLGYCEGETEEERARDFSVYRNSLYTYNIIVNGIDNIRVEATRDEERQPGLEGDVSDAGAKVYDMDSHYNQFNILLSNRERLDFSYQVEVPFRNSTWLFNSNDGAAPAKMRHFVDWVRIKPAVYSTSASTDYMAEYGPDAWTLEQVTDPEKYPGYMDVTGSGAAPVKDTMPTKGSKEYEEWLEREHYYTVFIDEYVYDKDENGNLLPLSKWHYFVNKPARRVWLLNEENRQVSSDGNSSYIRAKYIVTQRSIQTYYNTDESAPVSSSAIGVEHDNETLGYNMRWTVSTAVGGANGRYNMYQRVRSSGASSWGNYVKRIQFGSGNLYFLENGKTTGINHPESPYFMYPSERSTYSAALKSTRYTGQSNSAYRANPQSTDYYEALDVCLSRNRDLNGNGTIDANELRWVLPTYSTYAQIVAGAESLTSPLVDFSNMIAELKYYSWPETEYNGLYHFIASNKWFIWGEEGLSYGGEGRLSSSQKYGADKFWNLRCVRHLGEDMSLAPTSENPVTPVYVHDGESRKVTMTYMAASNLRPPTNMQLTVHRVDNYANRYYRTWEYRESDEYNGNGWTGRGNTEGVLENINAAAYPCSRFNVNGERGWRMPNQKELTLLYMNDVISHSSMHLSCTREYFPYKDGNNTYRRFLGSYGGVLTAFSNANISEQGVNADTQNHPERGQHIRCVRDIINTNTPSARSSRK